MSLVDLLLVETIKRYNISQVLDVSIHEHQSPRFPEDLNSELNNSRPTSPSDWVRHAEEWIDWSHLFYE